jgi:hypothetical protein
MVIDRVALTCVRGTSCDPESVLALDCARTGGQSALARLASTDKLHNREVFLCMINVPSTCALPSFASYHPVSSQTRHPQMHLRSQDFLRRTAGFPNPRASVRPTIQLPIAGERKNGRLQESLAHLPRRMSGMFHRLLRTTYRLGSMDSTPHSQMKRVTQSRSNSMETVRFTAANGRRVNKVVTDSGTGYIAESIPLEAIQAWHRRLSADLRRPVAHARRILRRSRRRTRLPVRGLKRRRSSQRSLRLRLRGRPLIALR